MLLKALDFHFLFAIERQFIWQFSQNKLGSKIFLKQTVGTSSFDCMVQYHLTLYTREGIFCEF